MPPDVLPHDEYTFSGLEELPTPRLVVYRDRVERNIARMRELLEDIVPGSRFRHLRPHAKTHKSAWTTRLLLEHGIDKFKCTPHELDMLLESGALDILVAYPLLARDADRVAARVKQFPEASITAQVGCVEHVGAVSAAARRHDVEIGVLLDLDVGEHRTGVSPEGALALARDVARLEGLRLEGLHAYHGGHPLEPTEREASARRSMETVVSVLRELEGAALGIRHVVAGGSLDFQIDLQELVAHHRLEADVEVSPGTWVYWDSKYATMIPAAFEFGAVILSHVMDQTTERLVTLNLGYKRWAIDQGPVDVFSRSGLKAVRWSEEHTVLESSGERPRVGEALFIVPRHVCATVNLWAEFTLVRDHRVEEISVPVTARNR